MERPTIMDLFCRSPVSAIQRKVCCRNQAFRKRGCGACTVVWAYGKQVDYMSTICISMMCTGVCSMHLNPKPVYPKHSTLYNHPKPSTPLYPKPLTLNHVYPKPSTRYTLNPKPSTPLYPKPSTLNPVYPKPSTLYTLNPQT